MNCDSGPEQGSVSLSLSGYGDYMIPRIKAINQMYWDEEEQDVRVDAEGKDGYMMNRERRDTVRDPI